MANNERDDNILGNFSSAVDKMLGLRQPPGTIPKDWGPHNPTPENPEGNYTWEELFGEDPSELTQLENNLLKYHDETISVGGVGKDKDTGSPITVSPIIAQTEDGFALVPSWNSFDKITMDEKKALDRSANNIGGRYPVYGTRDEAESRIRVVKDKISAEDGVAIESFNKDRAARELAVADAIATIEVKVENLPPVVTEPLSAPVSPVTIESLPDANINPDNVAVPPDHTRFPTDVPQADDEPIQAVDVPAPQLDPQEIEYDSEQNAIEDIEDKEYLQSRIVSGELYNVPLSDEQPDDAQIAIQLEAEEEELARQIDEAELMKLDEAQRLEEEEYYASLTKSPVSEEVAEVIRKITAFFGGDEVASVPDYTRVSPEGDIIEPSLSEDDARAVLHGAASIGANRGDLMEFDLSEPLKIPDKSVSMYRSWSQYYQTDNNILKTFRAGLAAVQDYEVPYEAQESIRIAAGIFEGDRGYRKVRFSREELTEWGNIIGQIESAYLTKKQDLKTVGDGKGVARSYWQIEPKTAIDLFKNSSKLFGKKFEAAMSDEYKVIDAQQRDRGSGATHDVTAVKYLKGLSEKQMSEHLLEDSDLAATIALAVIVNRIRWSMDGGWQ